MPLKKKKTKAMELCLKGLQLSASWKNSQNQLYTSLRRSLSPSSSQALGCSASLFSDGTKRVIGFSASSTSRVFPTLLRPITAILLTFLRSSISSPWCKTSFYTPQVLYLTGIKSPNSPVHFSYVSLSSLISRTLQFYHVPSSGYSPFHTTTVTLSLVTGRASSMSLLAISSAVPPEEATLTILSSST